MGLQTDDPEVELPRPSSVVEELRVDAVGETVIPNTTTTHISKRGQSKKIN